MTQHGANLPVSSLLIFDLQGHLREGKCHLSLGNAMAASRCFQRVLELEPDNSQVQQEVSLPRSESDRAWSNNSDMIIHYQISRSQTGANQRGGNAWYWAV